MSYLIIALVVAVVMIGAFVYVNRKYPDKVDAVEQEVRDIHKPF